MTTQEEHTKLCEVLVTKLESRSFYVNVDYSKDMPSGYIRRNRLNISSQVSFRFWRHSDRSYKLIVKQEQRNDSLLQDRLFNHHVVTDAKGTQITEYALELNKSTIEDVVDWFCTYFYA